MCFGQLLGELLSSLHAGETGMTNTLYDGVTNRCTAQRSPAYVYCMNVSQNMDQMNMHEDTAYSDYIT